MKDEHKAAFYATVASVSVYTLNVVFRPLTFFDGSLPEWLASRIVGLAIVMLFGVLAYRIFASLIRARKVPSDGRDDDSASQVLSPEAFHLSSRLVGVANRHTEMIPLLRQVVAEIKDCTGCASVGIRILDQEGNMPYLAYEDFGLKFYEVESPLSVRRDRCMCSNVMTGVTDPTLPFYTKGGSFHTNETSRVLSTVKETEKGQMCDLCSQYGYESVALIPIRAGDRILGLVHVADPGEKMIRPGMVQVLERTSIQLGLAIQRTLAEEAVKNACLGWRVTLDAIEDAVCLLDTDGRIMRCNRAMANLVRKPFTDIIGHTCCEFVHGTSEHIEGCPLVHMRQTCQTAHIAMPIDDRWFNVVAYPVVDGTGSLSGAVHIMSDITVRRQAEEALRSTQGALHRSEEEITVRNCIAHTFLTAAEDEIYDEMLKIILTATRSSYGVFGFTDTDGTLITASVCGESSDKQYIPHRGSVVLTENWPEIWTQVLSEKKVIYSNDSPQMPEGYADVSRAMTAPIVHKEDLIGVISIADKSTDYDECDRRLIQAIVEEITPILNARLERDRKEEVGRQSEAEREKIQTQLAQAQKMEAIGVFAGTISEDFHALLSSIQDHASQAMIDVGQDSAAYENLKQIRGACIPAANLTRQLLLLSGKNEMKTARVDLNTIVHKVLQMLGQLLGRDITVTASLKPDLWDVRVDGATIEQVLMNLVENTRDVMPQGGCISIRTENVAISEGYCKINPEARPGEFVCLSITDEGVGMSKEARKHIFEPFYSTKESGETRGLGLSVVHGTIEQYDGWITIYSEPGHGTTFRIYLPAASETVEEHRKDQRLTAECQGRGERILVVEDEEVIRELVTLALTDNGYVVYDAGGFKEALNIFKREDGEFDLLFSDVVLTDGNGLRLAERLVVLKPKLEVLLTSGYINEAVQWVITCEKGYQFLRKPYAMARLLQAVRRRIDSQQVKPQTETAEAQAWAEPIAYFKSSGKTDVLSANSS